MLGIQAVEVVLDNVRNLPANQTSVKSLSDYSRQIDEYLWSLLPLSWRTQGLSGWLSCELVLGQRTHDCWGTGEKKFVEQLELLRSMAVRGMWVSSVHWPLLSIINSIFSTSGNYDPKKHHENQCYFSGKLSDNLHRNESCATLNFETIDNWFLSKQWPEDGMLKIIFKDIAALGECIDKLVITYLDYDEMVDYFLVKNENLNEKKLSDKGCEVGLSLLRLGDYWEGVYERLAKSHGGIWQYEVESKFECRHAIMEVGLKALLYYRNAMRWFDEGIIYSIAKSPQALGIKEKAENAWSSLGDRMGVSLGLWSSQAVGSYSYLININKKKLENARDYVKKKLIEPLGFRAKEDADWLYLNEKITPIMEEIQQVLKNYLGGLWQELSDLLRDNFSPWPCAFGVVGYGSIEKGTSTLYSDIEYGVVLAEDTPASRDYARRVSYGFSLLIQGLGETPIPMSEFSKESDGYAIFDLDKRLPSGLCLDLGMKVALGRRYVGAAIQPELWGTLKYELIGNIDKLVSYLDKKYFSVDPLLPVEMMACTAITGDGELIENYRYAIHQIWRKSELVNEESPELEGAPLHAVRGRFFLEGIIHEGNLVLMGDLTRYSVELESNYTGQLYDVKQNIYRVPDRLCDDVAIYYGIHGKHLEEKLKKLERGGVWTHVQTNQLRVIMTIANVLRLEAYQHYGYQCDKMSVLPCNQINEDRDYRSAYEERLVRFYKTAIPFQEALKSWLNSLKRGMFFSPWDEYSFYEDTNLLRAKINYRLMNYEKVISASIYDTSEIENNLEETILYVRSTINCYYSKGKSLMGIKSLLIDMLYEGYEDEKSGDKNDAEKTLGQDSTSQIRDFISSFSSVFDRDMRKKIDNLFSYVSSVLRSIEGQIKNLLEDKNSQENSIGRLFFLGGNWPNKRNITTQKELSSFDKVELFSLLTDYGVLVEEMASFIQDNKLDFIFLMIEKFYSGTAMAFLRDKKCVSFFYDSAMSAKSLISTQVFLRKTLKDARKLFSKCESLLVNQGNDKTETQEAFGDFCIIYGNVQRRSENFLEAEKLYRQAEVIFRNKHTPMGMFNLMLALKGLAYLYKGQVTLITQIKDIKKASSYRELAHSKFEEIIRMQNKFYGKGVHPDVFATKLCWFITNKIVFKGEEREVLEKNLRQFYLEYKSFFLSSNFIFLKKFFSLGASQHIKLERIRGSKINEQLKKGRAVNI